MPVGREQQLWRYVQPPGIEGHKGQAALTSRITNMCAGREAA